MTTIEEAGEQATKFVREQLHLAEARLIRAARGESGWEVEVEVYEESAFIKALGLPTRVRDRNIYLVRLDDELNVQSYERSGATV
jgi:hypothetical protein